MITVFMWMKYKYNVNVLLAIHNTVKPVLLLLFQSVTDKTLPICYAVIPLLFLILISLFDRQLWLKKTYTWKKIQDWQQCVCRMRMKIKL